MKEIRRYITVAGREEFTDWITDLADTRARARINARIVRMAHGNLGDIRSLGRGLFELRVDCGPGYRVYFAQEGAAIVVLFCGGDKRRQSADILHAFGLLAEYKERRS